MISPARLPNCLKSTGATSPLSSKRTDTLCWRSDLDHPSSRSLSFSLCLLATGTPKCSPALYILNEYSLRRFPDLCAAHIPVPNLHSGFGRRDRSSGEFHRFGLDHL